MKEHRQDPSRTNGFVSPDEYTSPRWIYTDDRSAEERRGDFEAMVNRGAWKRSKPSALEVTTA